MMATLLGTLLLFVLFVLLLAAGPLLSGRPMHRGCGNRGPATPRCGECPRRAAGQDPAQGDSE